MNDRNLSQVLYKIKELLEECDEPVIVAIDGKSAAGKTTLSKRIGEQLDCNVFHMDDFFLQPFQRTRERLEEVGGNVDYQRFFEEVLSPLLNRETVAYCRYICHSQTMAPAEKIPFKRLNIIEGAYSMHPCFDNPYALRIFMDIDENKQLANIRKRNGEKMLERFQTEWIPKENAYIGQFHIREKCDIYIVQ